MSEGPETEIRDETVILQDPDVLIPDDPALAGVDASEDDFGNILVPLPPVLEAAMITEPPILTASPHPNVMFPREIHPGVTGGDVESHKRAISRWNPKVYPWHDFTGYAGEYLFAAVLIFKKQRGLGKAKVIGARTHEALERTRKHGSRTEWAFDRLAVKQAQDYWDAVTKTPEERIREGICQAGFFWYARRYAISYSQYRPMALGSPPWTPTRWDCSGFYTAACHAGGAPDPNGRGYDHLGYTGTLMTRGTRVSSVDNLKPGDAIFYGHSRRMPGFNSGDPTHVALYVGNRMILTLGSYPMKYVPYNYRSDINHYRHYQFA